MVIVALQLYLVCVTALLIVGSVVDCVVCLASGLCCGKRRWGRKEEGDSYTCAILYAPCLYNCNYWYDTSSFACVPRDGSLGHVECCRLNLIWRPRKSNIIVVPLVLSAALRFELAWRGLPSNYCCTYDIYDCLMCTRTSDRPS